MKSNSPRTVSVRESSSRSYDGNVSPYEVAVFVLNFLIRIRPVQTDVLPSLQLRLLPNKPHHFHSSCFLVFFLLWLWDVSRNCTQVSGNN